jgi:hypothetical protein
MKFSQYILSAFVLMASSQVTFGELKAGDTIVEVSMFYNYSAAATI